MHCALGETENDDEEKVDLESTFDEDSEYDHYDNDLVDEYNDYQVSLETEEQFSNENEESKKVDYTHYLCKVGDCGKFYSICCEQGLRR